MLNIQPGMLYQHVYGRIPHQQALLEKVEKNGSHHFTELARRAMDALGLDYQIVFPTPMLTLGMHPQDDIEAALGGAYNRWLVERILPEDDRLKGLLYLPFNTPEACVEQIKRYGHLDSVIGFTVCSTRNKPVHHNSYMQLYAIDGGDRQAARLPLRLQLERSVVPRSSIASSRCTRCRSCTTA